MQKNEILSSTLQNERETILYSIIFTSLTYFLKLPLILIFIRLHLSKHQRSDSWVPLMIQPLLWYHVYLLTAVSSLKSSYIFEVLGSNAIFIVFLQSFLSGTSQLWFPSQELWSFIPVIFLVRVGVGVTLRNYQTMDCVISGSLCHTKYDT